MSKIRKILLSEDEIPKAWYNIQADLQEPLDPPLHPGTLKPLGPEDLSAIFPMALIEQEMSRERWIEIPDEVREKYSLWRPSPLIRAYELEKALDTPAKIYFKYEGSSPVGSHKLNTALAQAYYNKKAGISRLATETGAGQWGCALSMACKYFDLECMVYMVKVSFQQKPYRRSFMEVFNGSVIPSPSEMTAAGRAVLAEHPDSLGSLAIAISEAVEDAAGRSDTNYALGSVLNHVLLHQTVIGLEAKAQLEKAGDYPDVVVACNGGGSNFGGMAFPFVADRLKGNKIRAVAVEPSACPTLTRGVYAYDFGDLAKMTPIMKMYTLGHAFMPAGIHAGGLRYHGDSPLVSALYHHGHIEARSYNQKDVFQAAILFAQSEGILPAPESSHAIKGAIDEAIAAREEGKARTILFGLSGHGFLDLGAYDNYLAGKMVDVPCPEEDLRESLKHLPNV